MAKIEFRVSRKLGDAGAIEVLRDGRRLGGIYHPADGIYRFHLREREKLGAPEMAGDADLEQLKAAIRSKYER
jgi:hypothetical protein